MYKTLFRKLIWMLMAFILTVFSISIIEIGYNDVNDIGRAEISLIVICALSMFMVPVLKYFIQQDRVLKKELRVYGNGIYWDWMGYGFIVMGVVWFIPIFIFDDSQFYQIINGAIWLILGLTAAKKGYIILQKKTLTIKGKDFRPKNTQTIDYNDNKLIITHNYTIYKYSLDKLSDNELEKFWKDFNNSVFAEHLNQA